MLNDCFACKKVSFGHNFLSWRDWDALIQANFERVFFVPLDPKDDAKFDVDVSLVHRRGIYKGVVNSLFHTL